MVWEGQVEVGDVVAPAEVVPGVKGDGGEAGGEVPVGGQGDIVQGVQVCQKTKGGGRGMWGLLTRRKKIMTVILTL